MAKRGSAPGTAVAGWVVANPRGIPAGRYILRNGERRWFEGDAYDGPVTDRLVADRFIVPSPAGAGVSDG